MLGHCIIFTIVQQCFVYNSLSPFIVLVSFDTLTLTRAHLPWLSSSSNTPISLYELPLNSMLSAVRDTEYWKFRLISRFSSFTIFREIQLFFPDLIPKNYRFIRPLPHTQQSVTNLTISNLRRQVSIVIFDVLALPYVIRCYQLSFFCNRHYGAVALNTSSTKKVRIFPEISHFFHVFIDQKLATKHFSIAANQKWKTTLEISLTCTAHENGKLFLRSVSTCIWTESHEMWWKVLSFILFFVVWWFNFKFDRRFVDSQEFYSEFLYKIEENVELLKKPNLKLVRVSCFVSSDHCAQEKNRKVSHFNF